ncbi:Galactose/lactose metabolism regulatory GAL80-like protein [Cladobotryum mycophilum]|uniref:Galactose/lactose metabolism regulatory GAL80-like protein n=1 Tax=Cladobotryum mycophilum TaxID=491253 RepID=A0ABR0SAW7_9HYPO
MAPIRVGLIGLSAGTANPIGAHSWGITAHLATYLASPHYELVAVCNSSVESARRSIEFHKLPATVKAYGSAEDLANDPDIDLISVSIMVGGHFLATKPALFAKKQVFVEWPLGANTSQAEEMHRLAKEAGLQTAVGTQFRVDPIIIKAKQLIDSGAIGRVTSTQADLCSYMLPLDTWFSDVEFYLDLASGGNDLSIWFGHFLDGFIYTLGDFATLKSTFAIQHPVVKTIDTKTGEVVNPERRRTAPDHLAVNGTLESGAVASLTMRKTPKPVNGLGLRWVISGTEGELELTIDGNMLQMGSDPRHLRLAVGKTGEVQEVDWQADEPEHVTSVKAPGLNTARLFEAYALKKEGLPDFEEALKLHKLLDRIVKDAGY